MSRTPTYREILYEIALDNYGYITPGDAADAGIPKGELPKLARQRNGELKNISYGLYRFEQIPASPLGYLAEAVKRVDKGAYLHGESVLELHQLADVNPRFIKVASPRQNRKSLPRHIKVSLAKTGVRTTLYEGIPCQFVADAILECKGKIEGSRLVQAALESRQQGLINTKDWNRVQKGLSL